MDLEYGPEYDALRDELRAFLAEAWPESQRDHAAAHGIDPQAQRAFIAAALERKYLYCAIPTKYGGSEQPFDALRESIIAESFNAAGAPWRLGAQGVGMIVPTLLEAGTEWQKEKFIPSTLRGEFVWCQGYSEPGAGSDLASLRSTARLESDEWVINGHKVWTSDAADANYMFGMFRTEPDAPKHGGISYLLMEMDQPGMDVRPLRQINGATHFYEVFFSDVRTPADWIVGARGQGWQIGRINLKHERNLGGGSLTRNRFDSLVDLARSTRIDGRPAIERDDVRQRLAALDAKVRCCETLTLRQLSSAANDEQADDVLATLVNKLYNTDLGEEIVQTGYDLIGDRGLEAPKDSTWTTISGGGPDADWVDRFLFQLAGAIAAGSSNIQRNVIGERGLGLPRDLRSPR
ncbi:MAG: acyl-CoA dehydrogenase family protein [Myxococcota bacterium]|nr:acyl-CoA dehydrogenase family protein [Myxococcota bacterium]